MSTLRVNNLQAVGGTGTITVSTGNQVVQTGAILQVKSTTLTTTYSASVAANGITDVTGLDISITPSSTSSQIWVVAQVSKGTYGALVLKRDSTEIAVGTGVGSRNAISSNALATNGDHPTYVGMNYLDSPNTTSAVTYKVSLHQNVNSTATLYCNRSDTDTDSAAASRGASSITVMEVAG